MKLLCAIFELCPSLGLGVMLGMLHIGALLCVLLVNISYLLQISLSFYMVISFVVMLRCYVLLNSGYAIYKFGFGIDNKWYLLCRNSKLLVGVPCQIIFVGYSLIIMNFRCRKKLLPVTLILCKDAFASANNWRKLRKLLKDKRV